MSETNSVPSAVGTNRSYWETIKENILSSWEKIKHNTFANMVLPFEDLSEGNTLALLPYTVPGGGVVRQSVKEIKAGRATNQIENGKKIIKTTELTEFPKEIVNIATYCDRKFELGGELNYFSFLKSGGSIHIKPENKGKFTETKKRTGKTTEELTHSKNPITRKRAIFA